jgi:hypothetical protein
MTDSVLAPFSDFIKNLRDLRMLMHELWSDLSRYRTTGSALSSSMLCVVFISDLMVFLIFLRSFRDTNDDQIFYEIERKLD